MIVCVYKVKFTIQARNHEQSPSPHPFLQSQTEPGVLKRAAPTIPRRLSRSPAVQFKYTKLIEFKTFMEFHINKSSTAENQIH